MLAVSFTALCVCVCVYMASFFRRCVSSQVKCRNNICSVLVSDRVCVCVTGRVLFPVQLVRICGGSEEVFIPLLSAVPVSKRQLRTNTHTQGSANKCAKVYTPTLNQGSVSY